MKPERVAWHAETPTPIKKYDPRSREDRISRVVWEKNITQRDREVERQRRIEFMLKKFPDYSLEQILKRLRNI